MLYILREALSQPGYYVSLHEHDGGGVIDQTAVYPTREEADEAAHAGIGYRIPWREPDEECDGDVLAVAEVA